MSITLHVPDLRGLVQVLVKKSVNTNSIQLLRARKTKIHCSNSFMCDV